MKKGPRSARAFFMLHACAATADGPGSGLPLVDQQVCLLYTSMSAWCGRVRLAVVPFTEIQEAIRDNCPEDIFTTLSLGLDYKPNENFSLYLSPIAGKWTFVRDTDRRAGHPRRRRAYGCAGADPPCTGACPHALGGRAGRTTRKPALRGQFRG